jgi:hypothetical protein
VLELNLEDDDGTGAEELGAAEDEAMLLEATDDRLQLLS